jgi:hypothetical protein
VFGGIRSPSQLILLNNKLKLTLFIVGLSMAVHANMFLLLSGIHSNAPFLSSKVED